MTDKAWVRTTPNDDGDEAQRKAYEQVIDPKTGEPAHIIGVQIGNPQAMLDHVALYRTLMFKPSPLSRRQREMIALVVSKANDCVY
jgi:alkylhydroperoxidase family enzyme